MRFSTPRRPVVVVVVAAALTLTGCRATQPPPTQAPTPAPTPSPSPRPVDPVELAASYDAPTPTELASRLVEAERAIRNPATDVDDLEEAGRVQQASYRQLVRTPELREQVLDSLPTDLRVPAEANIAAGEALRRTLRATLAEAPPDDWTIVAPPPAAELRAHYEEAETAFGVPWRYLASIHLIETRMGRIMGDSHAGARGPMQFMPATWDRYGEGGDILDPGDSIAAAARMLRANGAPHNMDNALYRYNPTGYYVRAVSAYADVMGAEPLTFRGYYHWQVYYATTRGDALLEVGYGS